MIILDALIGPHYGKEFILTQEFNSYSLVYKHFYVYMHVRVATFTYFVAFLFMDSASIASGLAFNGYDPETKQPLFNRIKNISIW